MQKVRQKRTITRTKVSYGRAAAAVEFTFYLLLVYAILGDALGVSVPLIGAVMLAVLAVFCVWRLRFSQISIYKPIALPLACAVSYILIQVVVHDESINAEFVKPFVIWTLSLIIINYLCIRPGFFQRFGFAIFVIGLLLLPYLNLNYSGDQFGVERAGLEHSVGLSNPNDLGAWFGFCTVFFMITGLETKRSWVRVVSWFIATVSLYVVALTVSRGSLLAVAGASIVAVRHLLKRAFFPVLCLSLLLFILYVSGIFEQSITFLAERGTEETGRLLIWPLVSERFLESPLFGVGVSQLETFYELGHIPTTPHNGVLFVALASGIVPLSFFLAYWAKVIRGVFNLESERKPLSAFCMPLLMFSLIATMVHDLAFLTPWAMVTLTTAVVGGSYGRMQVRVVRGDVANRAVTYSTSQAQSDYADARDTLGGGLRKS